MRWEDNLNDTNSVFPQSVPNVSWAAIGATEELNQHVAGQEKQQPGQITVDVEGRDNEDVSLLTRGQGLSPRPSASTKGNLWTCAQVF